MCGEVVARLLSPMWRGYQSCGKLLSLLWRGYQICGEITCGEVTLWRGKNEMNRALGHLCAHIG